MKNILLVLILALLSLTACKRKNVKETIETPTGFTEYTENTKPNDKKNLFFFHLHHCPNCTLVQNHLIKSDAFQEMTKGYNRHFLELGRPLGKDLMEKYSVRGAPVFVLADVDFSHISTSSYGLLALSSFKSWLDTGSLKPPYKEGETLNNIIKEFKLTFETDQNLYKLYSYLKDETDIKLDWNKFITYSDKLLQEWSNSKINESDKFANHYRIGLSYLNLASLSKEKTNSKYNHLLIKALKEYEKINSGDVKSDAGSYIFQIAINIRLENDQRVEELVKLLEEKNPSNKTLLYIGVAHSYLEPRKDCEKVLEYTSKMNLTEIPTQADRIYQVYFRAQCHNKTKDISSIKSEYAELLKHLDKDFQEAFPDKLQKIKQIILELEQAS